MKKFTLITTILAALIFKTSNLSAASTTPTSGNSTVVAAVTNKATLNNAARSNGSTIATTIVAQTPSAPNISSQHSRNIINTPVDETVSQ